MCRRKHGRFNIDLHTALGNIHRAGEILREDGAIIGSADARAVRLFEQDSALAASCSSASGVNWLDFTLTTFGSWLFPSPSSTTTARTALSARILRQLRNSTSQR